MDLIQPYRLEMGTKFPVGKNKNLYEFWKKKVTEALNEELEDNELFLNLASNEYFKVINTKLLKVPVITPVFKDYKGEKLMYVPDKNLGIYLREKYNLDMEVWPGFCCLHNDLTIFDVFDLKKAHPNAEFIVHPQAKLEVHKLADFVGSTNELLNYVIKSDSNEFIVGTEDGILHTMRKTCPDKLFHIVSKDLKCYDMKLTHLSDVYFALKDEQNEITLPEKISKKAFIALDRMLKLG